MLDSDDSFFESPVLIAVGGVCDLDYIPLVSGGIFTNSGDFSCNVETFNSMKSVYLYITVKSQTVANNITCASEDGNIKCLEDFTFSLGGTYQYQIKDTCIYSEYRDSYGNTSDIWKYKVTCIGSKI